MAVMRESLLGRRSGSYGRAISEAAVFAAEEIGCRLIVVISRSGHMARRIASLRPRQRIIALTTIEKSYRQMALLWGIEPYICAGGASEQSTLFEQADRMLLDSRLAERGESVVVMAGRVDDIVISHSMKLHRVGDLVAAS
jgi:pyruvate kinase